MKPEKKAPVGENGLTPVKKRCGGCLDELQNNKECVDPLEKSLYGE
jgi:hypothetical protein